MVKNDKYGNMIHFLFTLKKAYGDSRIFQLFSKVETAQKVNDYNIVTFWTAKINSYIAQN